MPLAIEFGKKRGVIGFDINEVRINELKKGIDKSLQISNDEFKKSTNLSFTNSINDIKKRKIFNEKFFKINFKTYD